MNGPRDFAELKCSDKKRRRIALMLSIHNTMAGGGEWLAATTSPLLRRPKGWTTIARELGYKVHLGRQGRIIK